MSSSSSSPAPDAIPRVVRRKVRRGTSNCWECRRRKIRCDFEPGVRDACVSCKAKGKQCIPQTVALPTRNTGAKSGAGSQAAASAASNGEKRTQQRALAKHPGHSQHDQVLLNAEYQALCHARPAAGYQYAALSRPQMARRLLPAPLDNLSALSRTLFSFFPPPATTSQVIGSCRFFSHKMMREAYKALDNPTGLDVFPVASELPSPEASPVALARKLVELALSVQQGTPPGSKERRGFASSGPGDEANRYFYAAYHHVMSSDDLIRSSEGVLTLLLMGMYCAAGGHWKMGMRSLQRAMKISRMIGIDQLDSPANSPGYNGLVGNDGPKLLWLNTALSERSLALILGVPAFLPGNTVIDECQLDEPDPIKALEKLHLQLLGHMSLRGERFRQQREYPELVNVGYNETRALDSALRTAARNVPADWWIVTGVELRQWATLTDDLLGRFMIQSHHEELLIFTHLPYVVPGLVPLSTNSQVFGPEPDYTYSRSIALNASRRLISIFIDRHEYGIADYHSRGVAQKGGLAAVTLLLSHIDGHRQGLDNMIEHERPQDLKLVAKLIELIPKVMGRPGHAEPWTLTVSALKEVEAEAARGTAFCICGAEEPPKLTMTPVLPLLEKEPYGYRLLAPMLGTVLLWPEVGDWLDLSVPPPDLAAYGNVFGLPQASDVSQLPTWGYHHGSRSWPGS